MTEPPPQVPDADGDLADARTREVPPDPPLVQARPGRTRSHPPVPDEPPAPTRIRHFTVLRQIGQGGMGVVLSAFDDELDRKVAIKLMRPSHGDSLGRARLQREAQAMAKLAHPNIARVYEVGEFAGRVYIVMEYVQGETLRAWLRRGPHPWREVLAILQQAGRGLAVAHAGRPRWPRRSPHGRRRSVARVQVLHPVNGVLDHCSETPSPPSGLERFEPFPRRLSPVIFFEVTTIDELAAYPGRARSARSPTPSDLGPVRE